MKKLLLGLGEVAEALGVSKRSITVWQSRHDFPAPIAMGKWLRKWRTADVEAFLASKPVADKWDRCKKGGDHRGA